VTPRERNRLQADLADFCSYYCSCPKVRVTEAALREFIDREMERNRGLRAHISRRRHERGVEDNKVVPLRRGSKTPFQTKE
jgi:hypothetical protein